MSKKYSQKPQGGNNSQLEEAFKHNTSIGAEGDILFDAPFPRRGAGERDHDLVDGILH